MKFAQRWDTQFAVVVVASLGIVWAMECYHEKHRTEGELQRAPVARSKSVNPQSGNPRISALATGTGVLRNLDQSTGPASPKRQPVTANSKGQPRTDEASRALYSATTTAITTTTTAAPETVTATGGETPWQTKEPSLVGTTEKTPITSTVIAPPMVADVPKKSKPKTIRAESVRTVSTSHAAVVNSPSTSSYVNSMIDPAAKENTWTTSNTSAPAPTNSASARRSSLNVAPSANTAAGVSASSITPAPNRCATIVPEYQTQCATANRWLDDIGARFGAEMQRHYRWLNAERVDDWLKNGNGIPPADYLGAQGYDSPLGTCHDRTPFKNVGAWKGTVIDGKLRGWVRYHGKWYVGTATDATCTSDCVALYDHPCELPQLEYPFILFDGKGQEFESWWIGGDPGKEPQP